MSGLFHSFKGFAVNPLRPRIWLARDSARQMLTRRVLNQTTAGLDLFAMFDRMDPMSVDRAAPAELSAVDW
jgi:hypothetical protein